MPLSYLLLTVHIYTQAVPNEETEEAAALEEGICTSR